MNKESLLEGLATKKFGQNLVYFDVIGSTNEEAKKAIMQKSLPEGTVFLASRQTAGRGTDNNKWHSNNIEGLLFSLVLNYNEKISPFIMFLPAVALAHVLQKEYRLDAHVKWPNDVLIGNKKVCGILCEGIPQRQLVVGVGVNVNQDMFPEAIKHKAISIAQATGKKHRIETLFQHYMLEMENLFYSDIDLREAWIKQSKMAGKEITAVKEGVEVKVTVKGISPNGYLIVQTANGAEEEWISRSGLDIKTDY